MLFFDRLKLRLRSLLHRDSLDDQLSDEIAFHLEQQQNELVAEGFSPEEARLEACRRFGHIPSMREQSRDTRRTGWLADAMADVAYTFRVLRKHPSFALVSVLTLALGIGANTAFFATAYGVLFRPLPYAEPDRLIRVEEGMSGVGPVLAMRRLSRTADYAGYLPPQDQNLFHAGEATRARVSTVSFNLAAVLGVRPRLGRWFQSGEEQSGRHRLAVLSDALWRHRFNADPRVLGSQFLLNEVPFTIIGIMPADFAFPTPQTEIWVPVEVDSARAASIWGSFGFWPVGRLLPGSSLAAAQSEIRSLATTVRNMYPWRMPDAYGADSKVVLMAEATAKSVRPKLLVLAAATLLLLLIACGNVGNLLLARGIARRREFSLREALGATRLRLLRQLLTENVVLVVFGGAAGLLLAILINNSLPQLFPTDTPRLNELGSNPTLITGAALSMLLTVLLFTAAPLISAFRPLRSTRLSLALIAGQLALATTLLICAGLMAHTLWQLSRADSGIRATSLTAARLSSGPSRCNGREHCLAFLSSVESTMRSQAGVRSVEWATSIPLDKDFYSVASAIEDHPRAPRDPAFVLWNTAITPGYFQSLGIPLLEGRGFTPADRAGAPLVTIISRSTANRFWPGQSAIGKHVRPVYESEWRTIIGVVADAALYSVAGFPDSIDGVQYTPLAQSMPENQQMLRLAALIETSSSTWLSSLRATYPDLVVSRVATLREVRAESVADQRSTATLLTLFALLGFTLGVAGVHGVIAHRAAQRTREIGIRMALGATPLQLIRLVTAETLLVAACGISLGIFAAWTFSRYLQSLVYGITTHDPLSFILSPIVLLLAAIIAAAIPALRATHTDPSITLRSE